jgi:hypothetical protein
MCLLIEFIRTVITCVICSQNVVALSKCRVSHEACISGLSYNVCQMIPYRLQIEVITMCLDFSDFDDDIFFIKKRLQSKYLSHIESNKMVKIFVLDLSGFFLDSTLKGSYQKLIPFLFCY